MDSYNHFACDVVCCLEAFILLADESKGSKGTKAAPNNGSKWKSILKNIAEQVSQVILCVLS